jgi:tetratricopeptide (TPR) repeat protein
LGQRLKTLIKLNKQKYILSVLLLALCCAAFSQPTTDEQLATQFFQNKEYEKASDYYEKLYSRKSSQQYFIPYLNCLLALKDYKKAEKLVKKQIKQNPLNPEYNVDLGVVYTYAEEPAKASNAWEQAIKSIRADEQVFSVAKAFLAIRQYDYAIEAYHKGRKITANNYPYSFELADVYAAKGDKTAMINEYLDILQEDDSYIQSVQNSLQTSFGPDADVKQNELLKTELLKRINKRPDKTIFSELLIWMQIQQRDFDGALVQAKAIDKRKKEEGGRLMDLAKQALQNGNFDVAIKAYQYVIEKGTSNYFYATARMELLEVFYQKIILKGLYTQLDLTELEKNYQVTITELGKSSNTALLLKKLAHLQAFYLHKTSEAIALLEETIALPKLSPTVQAECKLELADVLLMSGDIWEASLRYSQVEKAFKHDAIGQEAKFRNARISYYTGDFKWAQAQLDVLKGATSKLIANDAMNLSMTISDALAMDTNTAPLLIFSHADLLAFQNKDEQAIVTLDSINALFPGHALADEVLYKKAGIALKHGKYEEAAAFYNSIIQDYGDDIIGDDAMFNLAELNEYQFKNAEKAKELYQQLLVKYPGSLYVVEARKRFRKLRGDSIN